MKFSSYFCICIKKGKMKYAWTILIGLVTLVSCQSHQSKNTDETANPDSLMAWYENVFTKSEEDTTFAIPDYVYTTDWMRKYAQYIESHFEGRGDMWFEKTEDNSFDCKYWTLAYIDNDTIPEMLLYGGCRASGSIILTQYGGEVYSSSKGCFSYVKGANGLLHSQWKYEYDAWGEIYEMKNGKFSEIASYNLNTDLVDTSEVSNYGLPFDSLKCHYAGGEIGDSVVHISEIELNGKRLGACFGHDQYVSCTGFAQVKQTLDSLYYSKGTNTYFPNIFNTSRKPIDELISKIK